MTTSARFSTLLRKRFDNRFVIYSELGAFLRTWKGYRIYAFFQLAEGRYEVRIMLASPLDYERRNSYLINLVAIDGASDPAKRLNARATVAVDVLDVQVNNLLGDFKH